MRVLVIGASGRTGRQVVDRALGHGHEVTAFARSGHIDPPDDRVRAVSGDALDFDAVCAAIEGQDAVILAVGRKSAPYAPLHEPVAANVIHAMALHRVYRLSVLSAAGTFARNDPNISLAYRARIATVAKGAYDDLEGMERRVMASDLDWTIVRARAMSDDPPTGDYRITLDGSIPKGQGRVSRGDVAGLLLKAVESDTYRHQAVVIAPAAGEIPRR